MKYTVSKFKLYFGALPFMPFPIPVLSIQEAMSASMESLEENSSDVQDLDDELDFIYVSNEPEAWSVTVDKKVNHVYKQISHLDYEVDDSICTCAF